MEVIGMVAINDDGHDHDDGGLCERCQFIERLADYLDAASEGDPSEWHDATGGLIEHMHSALWALHRLRAESTTDYTDEIDNLGESARALVALGELIAELEQGLRS